MTTVKYIYHSCFVLESDDVVVVFDYWKDPLGYLHDILANTQKQVYVFVSHFHEDHYNPEILRWGHGDERITVQPRLMLSYDTVRKRRVQRTLVRDIMNPEKFYEDEYIRAIYYRSTDIGVAVALTFSDGSTAFHAGDLNNWYFTEGDHLKVSLDEMEGMYMSVVRSVRANIEHFTHVMLPIDPRLESNMLRSSMQWLNKIYTDNFYPMHFWHRYSLMAESLTEMQHLFSDTTFWYPMPLPKECVNEPQQEKTPLSDLG